MPDDITIGSGDRMMGAERRIDAVFTDKKDNSLVKPSDFLNLMIAQMRNQDFLNPMDDTQFVTQMAQFSTMQQMMELAEYSKSNYAMSLVGKTVTASRFNVSGGLDTTTGIVDRISMVDNEYILYIQDKRYTLSQVMEVLAGVAGETKPDDKTVDPSKIKLEAAEPAENEAVVFWKAATDDKDIAKQLKYSVYYSEEGPFNTLEEVKKGTLYGLAERPELLAEIITGLTPGTEYYINVVVKSPDGAERIYQPVRVTTKDEEAAVGEAAGTGETEAEENDADGTDEVNEVNEAAEAADADEAEETDGTGDTNEEPEADGVSETE